MNIHEVKNLINGGENSQVEFKSEVVTNEELAITMIAFLNGQGGVILLGVEDDAKINGIIKLLDKKINAINQVAQNRVKPPIIPILDTFILENKAIISITIEKGLQKPYYLIKNEKTLFYLRVGTSCRLDSPEQIAVYMPIILMSIMMFPLPDMPAKYLDEQRIHHYFIEIKKLTEKHYQA